MRDPSLLLDVVQHTREHFSVSGVDYDRVKPEELSFVPEGETREELRKDYAAMSQMLPSDSPTFDELIGELGEIEKRVRESATP